MTNIMFCPAEASGQICACVVASSHVTLYFWFLSVCGSCFIVCTHQEHDDMRFVERFSTSSSIGEGDELQYMQDHDDAMPEEVMVQVIRKVGWGIPMCESLVPNCVKNHDVDTMLRS